MADLSCAAFGRGEPIAVLVRHDRSCSGDGAPVPTPDGARLALAMIERANPSASPRRWAGFGATVLP
jgi:hypothetical protein